MTKIQINKSEMALSLSKTYSLEKPAEVIAMAEVLKKHVIQQRLFAEIKGKNYVMVEGWMLAGFLTGMNVIVEEPKNLSTPQETKWSVTAKIYSGDKLVGIGYALCSSKEAQKKGFDEYAILSMAQTRAIGKAYRNKIGWIMKLAGYEGNSERRNGEDRREVAECSHCKPGSDAGSTEASPQGTDHRPRQSSDLVLREMRRPDFGQGCGLFI